MTILVIYCNKLNSMYFCFSQIKVLNKFLFDMKTLEVSVSTGVIIEWY